MSNLAGESALNSIFITLLHTMSRKVLLPAFLIVLIGALFFIPFLGAVHLFDWDEINFAESAREMIVSGNYSRV